jgi:EpsI family protein
MPLIASFVLIGASGLAAFHISGRQEILPERTRFSTFPTSLADWRGRATLMEPQVEHFLGLTDYILSDYSRKDGRPVNLYIAYYASQRKGQSPHSPSVCIPGNGWLISKFERTSYSNSDPRISVPLNRVVIEKNAQKQLVYYWFVQRGKNIENEWWSKWYLLTDAILKNRTDGALVRLTTTIYKNETESEADFRLQAFARDLIPTLSGYLPSESPPKIVPAQNRAAVNHS